MRIDREALLRTFLAESQERLLDMESALETLSERPRNKDAVGVLFRNAHTLKGDAGFLGFDHVVELAHVLEDLLERVRDSGRPVTPNQVSLLLKGVDALVRLIPEAASGPAALTSPDRQLIAQLADATRGVNNTIDEVPMDPPTESGPISPATGQLDHGFTASETLRVDRDKLDRLLDLTGEIGVARGHLTQLLESPEVSRAKLLEVQSESDRLYSELQETVMKVRMVPIGPTFRHFNRVVRELARTHGKQARLSLEGESVEVDMTVIEHLRDPLTHMIRNAIDHGVESADTRSHQGKEACGVLTLSARHESGTIVISMSDDGAGLDRARILRRANEMGLKPGASEWTDQELDNLIFAPGFTTADGVTDLSGRGIGMEVVQRNIEALRGSTNVISRAGEGTTFEIRLPLTLAIIDGFQVGVGGETYIIPLEAVSETLSLPEEHRSQGLGRGVLPHRGSILPYARLRHLFELEGEPPARESIVVIQHAEGDAGLIVDTLQGEIQTVIKPLAKVFRSVTGLSGSAILGNGRVAFILDVPALLRRETRRSL